LTESPTSCLTTDSKKNELQEEVYNNVSQSRNPCFIDLSFSTIHSSSKLDLLVRVRYSNPLPAPPCPPKFLDIPTDPKRYTRPEFLNELANETPLPMIVDAELGMPLDLGKFECLWEEGVDDSGKRKFT